MALAVLDDVRHYALGILRCGAPESWRSREWGELGKNEKKGRDKHYASSIPHALSAQMQRPRQ